MDVIKPWYMSKTIWASIVTVACAAASALGMQVDPAVGMELTDAILQLVAAVAGGVAIFGRLVARSRIA